MITLSRVSVRILNNSVLFAVRLSLDLIISWIEKSVLKIVEKMSRVIGVSFKIVKKYKRESQELSINFIYTQFLWILN